MAFIYLATFKDKSTYIGQTAGTKLQLTNRYKSYTQRLTLKRSPVQRACGAQGLPELTIIVTCEIAKLDHLEHFWVSVFKASSLCLNIAKGGGYNLKRKQRLSPI